MRGFRSKLYNLCTYGILGKAMNEKSTETQIMGCLWLRKIFPFDFSSSLKQYYCKRSHFEARYFLWRIIILDMEQFTTLFLVSSLWVCVRWRLAKCNGTQIMSCTNSRSYLLHAQHEELTKLFWDNEEYKTSKSSHSSCNLSKKSI